MKADNESMRSESKVLALLAKQAKASKAAAAEFKAAKRDDLKNKEEAQLAVLEDYISYIPTVPEDEVAQAVSKILSTLKANGSKLHYGVCTLSSLFSNVLVTSHGPRVKGHLRLILRNGENLSVE